MSEEKRFSREKLVWRAVLSSAFWFPVDVGLGYKGFTPDVAFDVGVVAVLLVFVVINALAAMTDIRPRKEAGSE